MSNSDGIEINATTDRDYSESSIRLAERVRSQSSVTDLGDEISQHTELDVLTGDHLSESANEGNFKSLFGIFQFRHSPNVARSHAAVDLILAILCFALTHLIYLGSMDLTTHRSVALFSALVLLPLSLYVGDMYSAKRLRSLNKEIAHLALCWMFAFAAVGLFAFLSKTAADVSRVWITLSLVLTLVSLAGIRVLASLGLVVNNEANARNIVLVGDESGINSVMRNLMKPANSQIQLARVFDISAHRKRSALQDQTAGQSDSLKYSSKQLSTFIEKQRRSGAAIEQVWIAISDQQSQIVRELSDSLTNSSVDVCVVPDQYAQRLLKGDVTRYGDTDVVNVSEISLPVTADQFKRVVDVVVASVALLLASIPMLIVAALIKMESDGPVFFRQKRYGIDGREIDVLKFRSMFVHSDSETKQARKGDVRVTRVGRIIRRTSLDELPQLLNVLYGTMSLVGPRPHAIAHNEIWRQQIKGYMLRHKVRPGITGWAQVNGWRGETDTAFKMQQRVKYDLEYIRNWSPWLDLKILVLTVFVGFFHKNAY